MRVKKLVKTAVMAAMLLTAVAMQPGKQVEAAAYSNLMVSEGASEEVLLAPGESIEHAETWEFYREKPDFLK